MMNRRCLLQHGLALTPLATALLAACGEDDARWPAGMAPIKWDRDTCTRCSMVISDRRFAAQMRGGPRDTVFKFDDIGCAVTWCDEKHRAHPWMTDAATRFWVADVRHPGDQWLDARRAHYLGGARSPMGYDFGAYAQAQPGSVDYDTMARKVVEAWPANCRPGQAAAASASPASGAKAGSAP